MVSIGEILNGTWSGSNICRGVIALGLFSLIGAIGSGLLTEIPGHQASANLALIGNVTLGILEAGRQGILASINRNFERIGQ